MRIFSSVSNLYHQYSLSLASRPPLNTGGLNFKLHVHLLQAKGSLNLLKIGGLSFIQGFLEMIMRLRQST